MDITQRHRLSRNIWHYIHEIQWPANLQEPVYVVPGGITTVVAAVIPGCQVKTGGAFIHQKPLAHFV